LKLQTAFVRPSRYQHIITELVLFQLRSFPVKNTLLWFAAVVILASVTAPSLFADGNPWIPPNHVISQQGK
jgi:hypothetical protein